MKSRRGGEPLRLAGCGRPARLPHVETITKLLLLIIIIIRRRRRITTIVILIRDSNTTTTATTNHININTLYSSSS